jgi:hypothetical protein
MPPNPLKPEEIAVVKAGTPFFQIYISNE